MGFTKADGVNNPKIWPGDPGAEDIRKKDHQLSGIPNKTKCSRIFIHVE